MAVIRGLRLVASAETNVSKKGDAISVAATSALTRRPYLLPGYRADGHRTAGAGTLLDYAACDDSCHRIVVAVARSALQRRQKNGRESYRRGACCIRPAAPSAIDPSSRDLSAAKRKRSPVSLPSFPPTQVQALWAQRLATPTRRWSASTKKPGGRTRDQRRRDHPRPL